MKDRFSNKHDYIVIDYNIELLLIYIIEDRCHTVI